MSRKEPFAAVTRDTMTVRCKVGVDLMSFEIGDTVIVSQAKPQEPSF